MGLFRFLQILEFLKRLQVSCFPLKQRGYNI
ncbi:hypothetical protein H4S14_001223 [Agrobacterium vitis]|nr:hypothetical protein [Agrobacterium vitis]MBE1437492.1 hypothetical protein [Agrobacterium vitis]